jgi:hypothetical protein
MIVGSDATCDDGRAIRALTVWQPHATLVALGEKALETRSRPTSYRGPLAIHAGKHFPVKQQKLCFTKPFFSVLWGAGVRTLADLPLGMVLAIGELTAVLPTTSPEITKRLTEQEADCGNFAPGRWAWFLENVRLLPEPIPARGMQGLWTWRPARIGEQRHSGSVQ